MNIPDAIKCIPGYEKLDAAFDFEVRNDEQGYRLENWYSSLPRPTAEQIAHGWATAQAQEYRQQRAEAYPPIGDQLDSLWKMVQPPEGSEAAAMKAKIEAVKRKFPKGGA
jgi:hypothetical protein